jgi:hypothetical protein
MTQNAQARLTNLSGTRNYADLPHACQCAARWSGSGTCHCGTQNCHQTFTGVGAFDRHRKGGTCNDPATVGLVPATGRAFQAWTFPSEDSP